MAGHDAAPAGTNMGVLGIVEEARDFIQAKMQNRVALLRAKTRRLHQLDDEEGHAAGAGSPASEAEEPELPIQLSHFPMTGCRSRDKVFKAVAAGRIRRPVLAFTFRHRRSLLRVALDTDGSVAGGAMRAVQGSFSTRAASAVARRRLPSSLETSSAWTPWPAVVSCSGSRERISYNLDDSDEEAVVFRKPRYVSRESTWEGLGYSGLLGNEVMSEQSSMKPSGTAEESLAKAMPSSGSRRHTEEEGLYSGTLSLRASKEHLPDDENHVARRISSDERAKWRSSFNRFRHDGEIHRDDLNKALAHCGFADRRPALIDEALEQVTCYTALNREEFMQFVCLYESRLHELYRTEFLKYESNPGVMCVQSLPLLLQELGLEPRRVVLDELLKEVGTRARPSDSLGFRDVAAVMELLRAREGFLVAELDRFRGVFQDFDSDASGDMSAGELGSALSWLGFPYTNDKVQSLYKQSDMNGNGVLSESEFVICLRHIQDAELTTIRQFLRERAVANGYGQRISSVRELEALLMKLGYQTSAAALVDAMQEAGFCGKTDPEQLLDLSGIRMDIDDVCTLLHCLRNREGFTDAQMSDLRRAFQKNKKDDTERIPSWMLHKVLRWLGHCYSFDRAQQLIYEAATDPMGDQLDYTTFVKLVRKCRNFDRSAAVDAFHAADESRSGVLDPTEQLHALGLLGLAEFHHLPEDEKDFTLERFLVKVSKYQEDRLLFLRKYFCFTVAEYETLRSHFNRNDKEGNGTLRRYELARLVETLFPQQAHMPEFRPILVKLLKEANADGASPATDLLSLLAVTRKIKDESDIYHCSVYQKTLQTLNFSCREAAEFLSIYLPVTEEGTQGMTCEDMMSLFTRSFELTDSECQVLQAAFNDVLEEKGTGIMVNLSPGEAGLDFLGFMLVMRRVIEAGLGASTARGPAPVATGAANGREVS